ncbi:MAG: outer membrane beta-barrel protein [Gammaproteobacteria bacterium]
MAGQNFRRFGLTLGIGCLFLDSYGLAFGLPEPRPTQNWHYGAYIDLSYPQNLNSSDPHPWRSKLTTNRLNQFSPNMGMIYFTKDAVSDSRWGVEIGGQAGYDTDGQIPSPPRLGAADVLRYLSRANISYLAPIGNGLKFTAGLFNSFIGYESFYAKDNPNYTRSWIADYSPYFLIGAGAQYPVNDRIDLSFYLVNGFNYLAHTNNQPRYAGQFSWQVTPNFKFTENLFLGPEQARTDLQYWRAFANSILEWSQSDYSIAVVYDVGTEKSAQSASHVQTLWMGSAIFTRWNISGPWSVALRPELYWDPNGTLTGSIQFIKAITTTLEYKITHGHGNNRFRLEYRYDNSTGKQGGFYGASGTNGPLVAGQSSIFFAILVSFDR